MDARIARRRSSLSRPINRIKIPHSQKQSNTDYSPPLCSPHLWRSSAWFRRGSPVSGGGDSATHTRACAVGGCFCLSRCCCSCTCVVQCSPVQIAVDCSWFLGPLLCGVPLLLGLLLWTFPSASMSAPVSPSTSHWFRLGCERRNWHVDNLCVVSYPLPIFGLQYTFCAIC